MSSFSRTWNGAFAVNFDRMGGEIISVPTECHFPVAHFYVGATAVPFGSSWKRMIRLERYWIYMIITSWRLILYLVWPLLPGIYLLEVFWKFSCELSWTSSQFLGTWAECDSKCSYLDTSIGHYGTKHRFIVELGLLALHSDERSSKVREYLCCNFVFLLTPTWLRNTFTSERRLRLLQC